MAALTRPRYSQIYDTDYKQSVRLATTTNVGNLFTTGNCVSVVDGITVVKDDRILVKDQTDKRQNGIYAVVTVGTGTNGTWQRTKDADANVKVTSGMTITVSEGNTNANRTYKLATPDPIVINVTELTFNNPFLGVAFGANTNVQFNDGLFIGGSDAFTFNKATNVVTASGNVNSGNLNTTNITGTLLTASQPFVTTVGNITNLGVAGNLAVYSTIDSTSATTGAVILSGGLAVQKQVHVDSDTDLGGNLTLSRAAKVIDADFHSATLTDRVMFASATNNRDTSVGARPTGTNTAAEYTVYNASTVTNAGFASLQISTTVADLESGRAGSGTFLPLTLTTSASERVRVDINGNVQIGTANVLSYANVRIGHTTSATNTTSGALVVAGGAGIAGNVYTGNVQATNVTGDVVVLATSGVQGARIQYNNSAQSIDFYIG